jgi:hypothetical protein
VSSFRTYTLDGKRFAASSNVKGRWTDGATTPFTFVASVQPLKGNELLVLPEGQREKETYKLYTTYQLRTADEPAKKKPDKIQIFSKTFEVISVEPWQNKVIPHYKAIVSRIDENF